MSFRPALILATVLAAWSAAAGAETIKIGVTPGPHAQIFEAVKPVAAKRGLDIQLIEFSDYVVPNAALDAGDIQANLTFPTAARSRSPTIRPMVAASCCCCATRA